MGITVTETGTASGPADEAVVDLQVQVRRASAGEALDGLGSAVRVLFEVLGNGPATHHATANLGLGAEHDRDGRVRGHQASQVVTVVVPVADAGRMIADLVAAGGDDVSVRSLSQRATDREALRVDARADAVRRARAAADQHAALADRELGVLVDVVEGEAARPPRPAMRAMAAEAVPVAGGSDDVSVTVTATWELR